MRICAIAHSELLASIMNNILLIIVLSIVSSSLVGQVWNYPPEVLYTFKEYGSLKMDGVKIFQAWSREKFVNDSLGEFELAVKQVFDSLGRITNIVKGEDTVTYHKFIKGYWSEGIKNGEIFGQVLKFDKNDNIIYRRYGNQIDSVVYDNLNRPIARYSSYESCFWKYENGLLISYIKKNDGEIFEETKYYHDTVNSSLSYKTCSYSMIRDKPVQSCDSTFAKLNQKGEPTYVLNIDYSWNEPDTMIMTVEYDDNDNVSGGMFGCQRIEFKYNNQGYRIFARRYDCENKLIHEEKFEYDFYE